MARCSRVLFLTFKFEMSYVDGDVKQAAGYTLLLLYMKKLLTLCTDFILSHFGELTVIVCIQIL